MDTELARNFLHMARTSRRNGRPDIAAAQLARAARYRRAAAQSRDSIRPSQRPVR